MLEIADRSQLNDTAENDQLAEPAENIALVESTVPTAPRPDPDVHPRQGGIRDTPGHRFGWYICNELVSHVLEVCYTLYLSFQMSEYHNLGWLVYPCWIISLVITFLTGCLIYYERPYARIVKICVFMIMVVVGWFLAWFTSFNFVVFVAVLAIIFSIIAALLKKEEEEE